MLYNSEYSRNTKRPFININDWKRLPMGYRNAVNRLAKSIRTYPDNLELQRQLFEEFSQKYTVHIEILRKWKELEIRNVYPGDILTLEERETAINLKASQHFIDDTFLNFSFSDENEFPILDKALSAFKFDQTFCLDVRKFLHFNNKVKAALAFPNMHLPDFWEYYQRHSLSPISLELEERHEKAIILWEKIQLHKDHPRHWIRCLQETHDHEYVCQNIEVALAKMPFTKVAWKEYIEYLRTVDIREMLNVYSRYCHFFIDDWSMREKYRREIQKLLLKGQNADFWVKDYRYLNKELQISATSEYITHQLIKNCFLSLTKSAMAFFKSFSINQKHIPPPLPAKSAEIDEMPDSEDFPGFEPHFIEYIIANANRRLLAKFYSISKWCYRRRKAPLCHRLAICDTSKTISAESSFFITPTDLDHPGLKNIIVTHSLVVTSRDPLALSTIIPRIQKCDPWFIKIDDQILSFEEYCFLVEEGNVEKIWLENVIVQWKSGETVSVEFLIERLPKAKYMGFKTNTEIGPDTSKRLAEIQLENKIELFCLNEVDETFEIRGFSEFIRKNSNSNSYFNLHFKPAVTATYKLNFRQNLKKSMDMWFSRYAKNRQRPQINIY